ncbi:DUF3618 domain-containing protein [Micromonospora sp. NPDC047527]|uniref:DUF3618 domain-containing protein n=1 Tax=unclassified Micromonospora TaxID=2617518 RepID=UPI0033EF0750
MSSDPDRIRREIETTRNELSNDVDALTDRVNPRRIAGDRVGEARGALTRAKEKVMGSTSHNAQQSSERMSHMASSVRDEAQGNPLAAGVVAFGVGLLAASLVPPSGRERQLAGRARSMVSEHSGELREQASQVGHQVRDNMREPAQQAAQSVRSSAEQGMSAVREQGRSSAGQVQGQAHAAVDDIRQR